ncbi:MAG: CvpA family protein [Christensenellaceae bacterium]|nr:CvpA family protein [Christensenellaceae bacterium]
MNWVNIFFILVIAITVLEGLHRGFLHSALSLGTFFLSIITAFLLGPVVSSAFKADRTIFSFLLYYTEGAEKIANFEHSRMLISDLTPAQVDAIIANSSVTEPFATLIRQNVATKAFVSSGMQTIGEYFNMTMVCVVLNILSFALVFLIARLVYGFILGAVNYTVRFPELRQYDRLTGALFGATRGVLACFLIVMLVPVAMLFIPVDKVIDYFMSSSVGMFFYNNNFFLHLIPGTV